MVLKRKGFFLNLEESTSNEQAIQMAPVRELPDENGQEEEPVAKAVPSPAAPSSPARAKQETDSKPTTNLQKQDSSSLSSANLTTAEAIAAELAADAAARPAVSLSTFAPEMLRPGLNLRSSRRKPGSNLKGFRDMASDLFRS